MGARAELEWSQGQAGWIDAKQRYVGVRIGADDSGLDLVAVAEPDEDLLGQAQPAPAAKDGRVGGDLPVAGDHEPRARPLLPASREDPLERALPAEDADHGDHARCVAAVDRARVEAATLRDVADHLDPGRGDRAV